MCDPQTQPPRICASDRSRGIFCLHAGLSKNLETVEQIQALDRTRPCVPSAHSAMHWETHNRRPRQQPPTHAPTPHCHSYTDWFMRKRQTRTGKWTKEQCTHDEILEVLASLLRGDIPGLTLVCVQDMMWADPLPDQEGKKTDVSECLCSHFEHTTHTAPSEQSSTQRTRPYDAVEGKQATRLFRLFWAESSQRIY